MTENDMAFRNEVTRKFFENWGVHLKLRAEICFIRSWKPKCLCVGAMLLSVIPKDQGSAIALRRNNHEK